MPAASLRSVSSPVIPDASGDSALRAFLALAITLALIVFMSRKTVDHPLHFVPASAAHHASAAQPHEEWPAARASGSLAAPFSRTPILPSDFDPHTANLIYSRAMFLARRYDSRPYWNHPKLAPGAPTTRYTADLAIEHLIPCESMGRPLNRLDTNGKMSYGILQFQDWDEWQRTSGITGNPDNRADAIRMAEWAIQNGMINHWTCASTLKIM